MDGTTLLGLTVALLTTVSLFPQFVKTVKTKSTKDISLSMYVIFCAGILLWLVYGILRKDIAVIAAQILVFGQAVVILAMKIKYG